VDKNEFLPAFFRNKNAWFRRTGSGKEEVKIVTNFHLEIIRILQKYNYEERRWERSFDVKLEYKRDGRQKTSPIITLEPKQTGVPTEFSNAIWDVDFRTSYMTNPITLKAFMTYLYKEQAPNEIRVNDFFGFTTIDGNLCYLARNTCIKVPKDKHQLLLPIAPDSDGAFCMNDNEISIMLDDELDGKPFFECLGVDEDGLYKQNDYNIAKSSYSKRLYQIEKDLNKMIAGDQWETRLEGTLILGYIFSHLIFDDIFTCFNHTIFLYIHGPGNSGKGSLCELILAFFGLPFYPSPNPTISALETLLSTHSKVPLWIDEFVPENTPGKKHNIPDQYWNSYFQLTHRPVSSRNSRYKTAAPKQVRSSVLFCSNYLPKTDHFNSRLIQLEYTEEKRGVERHYRKLQGQRTDFQNIFLSALAYRGRMKDQLIRKELFYLKSRMQERVKSRLESKFEKEGIPFTLHDRQLEQFAALFLSFHLFKNQSYYFNMEQYYEGKQTDFRELLDKHQHGRFFEYCLSAIEEHSQEEANRNAFTEFLEVCGDLVNSPNNPSHIHAEEHYHWTKDGDLMIYWSAVWNRYAKYVGTVEAAAVKTHITKCMDALDIKGKRHTVNWSDMASNNSVRQKGYRIEADNMDSRLKMAFKNKNVSNKDKYPF
jgi:hypothetical protein